MTCVCDQMEEALEQAAQITIASRRSFLHGSAKSSFSLRTYNKLRESFHVIQHLLAKMYNIMYILVIFIFHLHFVSFFFKNNIYM